ncbi:MAG: hypothetical protein EA390_04635 [Balneolaceae bacterium]|nr:MAG: hypothetical protein EA390_04635 [Balneolaceae bacterium]
MKKILLLLFVSALFTSASFAQESVGFSDTDNIQPLLDYRLPAWGYSNLFWDFSLNSSLQGIDRDDESRSISDIDANLSPTYHRFYESEERVSTRSLSPRIKYSRVNNPGFTQDENLNRNFQFALNGSMSERFYTDRQDLFIVGSLGGFLIQNNSRRLQRTGDDVNVDLVRLTRFLNSYISGGIGYGRIRNVNPMIRSLRLNERLNALDTNQQMNIDDLRKASEQFTRVYGYNQVYDRPEKYFWDDMDSEISTQLMELNPFDLFYLTDVLSETIGQRLEGWEVVTRVNLIHMASYSKNENKITGVETSQLGRSTLLNPTLFGRWYKNLDLKNQVGLRADFSYNHDLSSDNDLSYYVLGARAEWLHTITDRFLAQPFISYQRRINDLNFSDFSVGSSFNYFVENNLSIFSTLQYSHTRSEAAAFTETRNRLVFNAGVRYYMRRGLF